MNPLGAFSFGKVIKTFIPGLIAVLVPWLTAELLFQWAHGSPRPAGLPLWEHFFDDSLLVRRLLVSQVSATAFVALLLPTALLLGFFLNTLLWMYLNRRFRAWVDRDLHPTLHEAWTRIEREAREVLRGVAGPGPAGAAEPPVEPASFLLPYLDLGQLTHINESYFSWYEFQANSALAVAATVLAYAVTFSALGLRWWHPTAGEWLADLALPAAGAALLSLFLVHAAKQNLARHRCCLTWFVVGSLHCYRGRAAH